MTKDESRIRTENRYLLHPQDKKRCTKCKIMYNNIRVNFDIHRKLKNGIYQYNGRCKACIKVRRAIRRLEAGNDIKLYCKRLIASVRCRAKAAKLPFDLTTEYLVELWEKQQGLCYYTSEIMDLGARLQSGKAPHHDFPSLDKLTPNLGYIHGNIVWCKYCINRMKSDLTEVEFMDFCRSITRRFGE